jgi:hypothetical protein
MSQIDLEVLKEGNPTKYVISCSFFTMNDAYRSFEKYRKALASVLGTGGIDPKYSFRIYTDDSSKNDALAICARFPNVNTSVIKFNCSEFRDGVGHTGTFGTLVRFLPLFEKDLEEVWITDIDIPPHYLLSDPIEKLMRGCEVFIQTNICYDRKVYARKYTIIANRVIFRTFFSKALLTRFINKLKDGKLEDIVQKLNLANTRKPSSKVPYGIDEVFMNTEIYNNLIKKDINCCILKQYYAENFVAGVVSAKEAEILRENYLYPSAITVRKAKKIYKEKIPLVIEKYPCLEEMLTNLDSFTTQFTKLNIINSQDL